MMSAPILSAGGPASSSERAPAASLTAPMGRGRRVSALLDISSGKPRNGLQRVTEARPIGLELRFDLDQPDGRCRVPVRYNVGRKHVRRHLHLKRVHLLARFPSANFMQHGQCHLARCNELSLRIPVKLSSSDRVTPAGRLATKLIGASPFPLHVPKTSVEFIVRSGTYGEGIPRCRKKFPRHA